MKQLHSVLQVIIIIFTQKEGCHSEVSLVPSTNRILVCPDINIRCQKLLNYENKIDITSMKCTRREADPRITYTPEKRMQGGPKATLPKKN